MTDPSEPVLVRTFEMLVERLTSMEQTLGLLIDRAKAQDRHLVTREPIPGDLLGLPGTLVRSHLEPDMAGCPVFRAGLALAVDLEQWYNMSEAYCEEYDKWERGEPSAFDPDDFPDARDAFLKARERGWSGDRYMSCLEAGVVGADHVLAHADVYSYAAVRMADRATPREVEIVAAYTSGLVLRPRVDIQMEALLEAVRAATVAIGDAFAVRTGTVTIRSLWGDELKLFVASTGWSESADEWKAVVSKMPESRLRAISRAISREDPASAFNIRVCSPARLHAECRRVLEDRMS